MILVFFILLNSVQSLKSEEYTEYKLVLDAGNNSTRVGLVSFFSFTSIQVEHVSKYTPKKGHKLKPLKSEEYSEYKLVLDAGNNSTRVGLMRY